MFKRKTKTYSNISTKLSEAKILAQQVNYQWEQAKRTLETARNIIEGKKEKNINVESILTYFEQAEDLFNKGNYVKSKEMADYVLRVVSEIENQWRGAKAASINIDKLIEVANSRVISLAEEEKQKSDEIKKLFDSGSYGEYLEISRKVYNDILSKINTYDQASIAIDEAKKVLQSAEENGVSPSHDHINDAVSVFQNQDYDVAINYANTAKHEAEKSISKLNDAKETIQTCYNSLQMAEGYIFLDDIRQLVEDANNALTENNFDKAITLARSCEENAQRLMREGKPIISIALPADLEPKIYNRSAVTVTNSGKAHARDVKITLDGKIETEGLTTIPLLKANESRVLEFALKSDVEGSIPVNITVNCVNAANDEPYSIQESTWLNIGAVHGGFSEAKILRETEFFRGFIRMKVAVQNDMSSVLTDVSYKPIFDEKVLRLNHIEPDYIIKNGEIRLGNLNPKERKAIAIYFDPMMCTKSNIDGTISYKDAGGNFKTGTMRAMEVNIICPIFFTEETANPAMLINLVKNVLKHQDSKVYNIPQDLTSSKAFEISKEAIQQRDIKHIRDFRQKSPYVAESWYYGVTKVNQNQMVIRSEIRDETNSIQIFVASSDEKALTGLLAELGHNLDTALKEKGITQPIQQVTNITIKDSIVQRSSLLFGAEDDGETEIEESVVRKTKGKKGKKKD